jgi:GMP synthase-like glutamine amidotransferase
MKKAYYPSPNPMIAEWLEKQFSIVRVGDERLADVIVFPGGLDVDPSLYNEPVGQRTSTNRDLDHMWVNVYARAMKAGKKVLGICKGSQFLTVMAGGTLFQHVEKHARMDMHPIEVNGNTYNVTSTHHQMMNPFDLPKDSYEILAFTPERLSTIYLDGYDDPVEDPPKEVEAIFYKGNGALAIQFHPEFMDKNHEIHKVIGEWIDKMFNYEIKELRDRYHTDQKAAPKKATAVRGGSGVYEQITSTTTSNYQSVSYMEFEEFIKSYVK